MTEAEQRRQESPLRTDRGSTTIKDTVVQKIAGLAAGEVEGAHMGGGASRSAGGLLGSVTGSSGGSTRGISVEVGSVETAIDLKMGIDYGRNILGTVGEVRQKITERVQNMTGLNVSELNVTISDITFPDGDQQGADRSESRSDARTGPDFDTRTMRRRELRPGASERETTEVEPTRRTRTEGSSGPVPDEEVRAEGTPVEEDEVRRLRAGDEEPSSSTETSSTETSDAGTSDAGAIRGQETTSGSESGTSGASAAEAPTDETTLTGGTDDRTQEIDRDQAAAAEERRARRRRRREERGGDGS